MKKLVTTAASLMAALGVYAQGTVDFQNLSTVPGTGIGNDLTGALVAGTDGIVTQLYWSLTMDGVFMPTSSTTGVGALGPGTEGLFFFGEVRIAGISHAAPPAGTSGVAFFEVFAWESAYGATYEEAIAASAMGGRVALRGESGVFQLTTGNPNANPPGTPPSLGEIMPLFAVDVPEPSVVGLGIIGAGALLMLRRRK